MPFPMKIQPIDCNTPDGSFRNDPVKPVVKSRFKRLFERQFQSVLRISSSEKPPGGGEQFSKDGNGDLEPSSVCLAKMVQNFIEESNDKSAFSTKCGRNRCNCFNGNCNDSSDDELDFFGGFSDFVGNAAASGGDASDIIKSLVSCASTAERNLLADTSRILEMNKICKPSRRLGFFGSAKGRRMALRALYNEIKGKKVKEVYSYLKPKLTIDAVKSSINRGMDNYHKKYILTSSPDPLFHVCFGGMIFSYLVALPEERRHLAHKEHAGH